MANILDPMDLKQIITLHLDGTSNRRIGSILGISRNTVNTYMQLFTASGVSLQELLDFENADLAELFSSHTTVDTERHNELMLYFEGVNIPGISNYSNILICSCTFLGAVVYECFIQQHIYSATFDWRDIFASLVATLLGYMICQRIDRRYASEIAFR